MPVKKVEKRDPNTAVLIAILGAFILSLPSLAYLYIGNSRKALVYSSAIIFGFGSLFVGWAFFMFFRPWGSDYGFELFLIPMFIVLAAIIFEILIIIDVYKIAKGEKALLPQI